MFITLMSKDTKLIMIVPHTCGTAAKCHIGIKRMKKLHADGYLDSFDFESVETCEPCLLGKMTKGPRWMERASDSLEMIHVDVCNPVSLVACSGYRYFLTFTDDLSRYSVHLLNETQV